MFTLADAQAAQSRGEPWTLRLEYVGRNGNNKSLSSAKFWQGQGIPGGGGGVKITWGRIGTKGQSQVRPWGHFAKKYHEKRAKGYEVVTGDPVRDPVRDSPTPPVLTPLPPAPLSGNPMDFAVSVKPLAGGKWAVLDTARRVLFKTTQDVARDLVVTNNLIVLGLN